MIRCGFADAELRLPAGLTMGGYIARTEGARGSHDPIRASAAVLEAGGSRGAIVALDLVAVTSDLAARIRLELADAGFAPELVLIAATHTHSGPGGDHLALVAGRTYYSSSVSDEISRAAVDAVLEASSRTVGATIGLVEGPIEGVAANRFFGRLQGPSLATVVLARNHAGVPLGAIVSYGVHLTVLGEDNLLYSADLIAGLRAELDLMLGRVPLVFLQGAGGDLSTRGVRVASTFDEADSLGRRLGRRVVELISQAKAIRAEPVIGALTELEVVARPLPSRPEAEHRVAVLKAKYVEAQEAGASPVEIKAAREDLVGASELAAMLQEVTGAHGYLPIQVIRIGEIAFVGVGAELFSELGERIRQSAPGRAVVVVTCANGYLSYVVTNAAADSHRYEAFVSWLARDTGERLVAAAGALVSRVFAAESPA